MLAQNFKSADELGLLDEELAALIKTLVLLETDKLKHVKLPISVAVSLLFKDRTFSAEFNMEVWSNAHECGTVCCLGGTAEMVGGLEGGSLDYVSYRNGRLRDLFYPQLLCPLGDITPAQAAVALRSYLTTGEANWQEATR